ncbi:hypothetical protein DES53_107234 [Roseimicrobium gellanilyticum]|uniref:Lipoprotein n=1 Tax=Roseimicrobium gellanilyticum TaxID=748857 RepID=A0A366HFR4_9BACT|nr:hypothetical protein [Roseimicrobium gellanilyticum]RBP41402.1 hypothetical protein DES53_107234 [Roseimicrobium gellanilyticum]
MHRLLSPTLLLLGVLALSSCETVEPVGPGRRPAPRVLIPGGLSSSERELLPEVEDALVDSGFRPTYRTPADYMLAFEVDDGPVNADVHLRLTRHGEEVAHAYARTGGPGILLHRREYIRKSFDKCIGQFEDQIEGIARRSRGRQDYHDYDHDDDRDWFDNNDRYDDVDGDYNNYGYDRSPRSYGRTGGYERGY